MLFSAFNKLSQAHMNPMALPWLGIPLVKYMGFLGCVLVYVLDLILCRSLN
jgi:hypothetical protein